MPSLGSERLDAAATSPAKNSIKINRCPLHLPGFNDFPFVSGAESAVMGWASGIRREGGRRISWQNGVKHSKTFQQDLEGVLAVWTPLGGRKSGINEEDKLPSQRLECAGCVSSTA